MGYQNARKVSLNWGDLPANAYKVLNAMAWASLDERPEWWGEPSRLVFALGRADWPRDGDRTRKANLARKRCLQAVADALHDLEGADAIVAETRPRGTRKGYYILQLDQPPAGRGRALAAAGLDAVDNAVEIPVENPVTPDE